MDFYTSGAAGIELEAIFCSYKLLHIDVTYVEEGRRRKSDIGLKKALVNFFDDNIRISR